MTIRFFRKLPECVTVAFSGGVDSVVLVDRLQRQGHKVTLAFQDHGNDFSPKEFEFVNNYARDHKLLLLINKPGETTSTSKEANWRNMRYKFFHTLSGTVVTGHHLDDALEHYIMTCARGQGHFMEYRNINVVRPFICTKKSDIVKYAIENDLNWLEDPSNEDVEFTPRNKVRHKIVPLMLEINPGLHETVRRNIMRKENELDKNEPFL